MDGALLRVDAVGPQVSVQDGGRPGFMRFGVPRSGPMDRKSHAIANRVLGNPPDAPAIEVSRGGLTLSCLSGPVTVAVVGGGFVVQRGTALIGSWTVLSLEAGQRLTLRAGPWGSWTYLAFGGTLRARAWLGSVATHAPSGLGGGALVAGQTLEISDTRPGDRAERRLPCPVWARPQRMPRAVIGPQDRYFPAKALAAFQSDPFLLTDGVDRMGWRLRGPDLTPLAALRLPSEPILRGAVQVSGDGVATLLLSDHQTTGGYPKIATVLSDDLDAVVQLRPHDRIRFQPVTPEAAVLIARRQAAALARYLGQVTG